MEHGDIIDIPYEAYHDRVDFMRAISGVDDPYKYFTNRASEIREYLDIRGAKTADQLITEEKESLKIIVDTLNRGCPFVDRGVTVSSSLHAVQNTDEIWKREDMAVSDSGEYTGIFIEFVLGKLDFYNSSVDLGLIAKTAVEVDAGEWIFFYTPLDIGTVTPILAELN